MKKTILASIKELVGIPADVADFDSQLLIHINAAFATLNQLGVGPIAPYWIKDTDKDLDCFGEEATQSLVLMYLYTKTRLVFDPPTSAALLEALKKTVEEYEFRLMNPTS